MSTITNSLLSQIAGSTATANEFVTDLNQLVKDVQSGNLQAAQQDWVTLSQDAQNGVTSSTATSSSSGIDAGALSAIAGASTSESSFVNELNLLGTDVENGALSAAQSDVQSLQSTAQSAVSPASTATGSTNPASASEIAALIRAIVAALSSGDSSAASSVMSELASVSPSSKGAAALQQQSESLGSSSSGSSSSLSTLLQSLSANSSGSTTSRLSLLA